MNREELRDFIRNQQPSICQVMAIKDDDLKADELFKDLGKIKNRQQ